MSAAESPLCLDCNDAPADVLYQTHCRACARDRKRNAALMARRASQADFINALREALGMRPLDVECAARAHARKSAALRNPDLLAGVSL